MSSMLIEPASPAAAARLTRIARAREVVLADRAPHGNGLVDAWIERSWRRCLDSGHAPHHSVGFDTLSRAATRRAGEASVGLTRAARPALRQLAHALSATGYFAILTDANGVVVETSGPIDRSDRRADLITRIGVDLSERQVGTTAIGAALTELSPVWLHRGEHFFDDTSCYSCAGAPLFGPLGQCVGMLDLTGIDAPERPELKALVASTAHRIENALALQEPFALLLRLNWPGHQAGDEADGLIGLDADGYVTSTNGVAREMVPQLGHALALALPRSHASELFAMPFEQFFDHARGSAQPFDLPLWSGLRLVALAVPVARAFADPKVLLAPIISPAPALPRARLKDIEDELIRKAVAEARGNVAQAAAQLGVSRATVYRKLGVKASAPDAAVISRRSENR